MARGIITKNDVEWKLHKLKNELNNLWAPEQEKQLANEYLNKALDYLKEFRA